MLFFLSFVAFVALTLMLVYRHRQTIVPRLPSFITRFMPQSLVMPYAPLSSFEDQRSAGLSSSAFDLEQNIGGGDSRSGLDERVAEEIRQIMLREGLSFDEARLMRQKLAMARNGIDPTGMPMDPKAVTRL